MFRLLCAVFIIAGIGFAFARAQSPVLEIGEGAQIIGPVIFKASDGSILLDVPKGSSIK